MVAISPPADARIGPAGRPRRTGGSLPALLLVGAPTVLVHVLLLTREAGAAAPAEAYAVAGAASGDVAPADLGFAGQLAAALAVVEGPSLLHVARGLCLLAGLLAALLLWPVVRRLELGGNAAAAAVIVAGLSPLALGLQPVVDPGALAAFWLVLAAALVVRLRTGTGVLAAVAAAAAVITSPLVAGGLLALVAHAMAAGRGATRAPAGRRATALVLAAAAVTAAVVTVAHSSAAVPGGAAVGAVELVVVVLAGVVTAAAAWWRRPELRPAVTMATVWLVCAMWPGPARLTGLLLAVPVLALLVGALVVDAVTDRWPRISLAAAGAVVIALGAGLATVSWPQVPSARTSYQPLARWLADELDPRAALSADPLDRAELVAAGVPAERFVAQPAPFGTSVAVQPYGTGCSGDLVAVIDSAGRPLGVCAPEAGPLDGALSGIGPLLAANPALELGEPARRALVEGRVDTRLMTVLAGAAVLNRMEIIDFPAVPGEPVEAPRRTAVLAGIVPVSGVEGSESLRSYLDAQQGQFRPECSTLPDGRTVVHFRVRTPDAIVLRS